jgi:hypothetical protein
MIRTFFSNRSMTFGGRLWPSSVVSNATFFFRRGQLVDIDIDVKYSGFSRRGAAHAASMPFQREGAVRTG